MRVFEENQKFTQSWLIGIIGISLIVPLFLVVKEWINNSDKSIQANAEALITLGIVGISLAIILSIKLKTRIDNLGIHYQFFPFHLKAKLITWNEIEKIYVRKYSPISEYGGWGYKNSFFNKSKGVAYNVSGKIGIQIVLKNGKKILIGTKKEEKVNQAISYNQNATNYE